MENNLKIITDDIYGVAKKLAEQKFTELQPASENGYKGCTHLIINKSKNQFWLSTEENMKLELQVSQTL